MAHRNKIIGLTGVTLLAATASTVACSDGGKSKDAAESPTGGAVSSTGGVEGTGGSVTTGGVGVDGGGGVTSLDGGRLLSDLTPGEATQLCDDAYAYFGETISQATLCKAAGLSYTISSSAPTDAVMQENCAMREGECLNARPYVPDCAAIPSPCTATVSDYATCVVDQVDVYNSTVSGIANCTEITSQDKAAIWDFVAALPESCTSLSPVCTGLDFPTPRVGPISSGGSGGTDHRLVRLIPAIKKYILQEVRCSDT